MDKFFIVGGKRLEGRIEIDSAKNAILPILSACILVQGEVVLHNIPRYSDVLAMCDILENLGASVIWQDNSLIVNAKTLDKNEVPSSLGGKVRASIFTLGAILGRLKSAKVCYPGGCDIGLRPIDIHIAGLKALGAKVTLKNGYIYASGENLKAGDFMLSFPSVGATENLIMLASCLKGESRIFNCAKEPEIECLANFINSCGGSVLGAGTNMITIKGKPLHSTVFSPIPDRIETGTIMVAVAIAGGKVEIENVCPEHLKVVTNLLRETGAEIVEKENKILISQSSRPRSFGEIDTGVYPSFPTDLQAQFVSLASISEGYSLIGENIFEARFKQVSELIKMGASIRVKGNICVVNGKEKLYGAEVTAPDLRGGAGLVLAGLKAEGYTTVDGVNLIDRGYLKFEEKLSSLGAEIKRISE